MQTDSAVVDPGFYLDSIIWHYGFHPNRGASCCQGLLACYLQTHLAYHSYDYYLHARHQIRISGTHATTYPTVYVVGTCLIYFEEGSIRVRAAFAGLLNLSIVLFDQSWRLLSIVTFCCLCQIGVVCSKDYVLLPENCVLTVQLM